MNKRYLFEGKTTKAIVEYEANNLLQGIKFDGGTLESIGWFLNNLPVLEYETGFFKENFFKSVQITELPPDLSFVLFYNLYDYKIGKKERTIKLWQALSEADRVKVLTKIPAYKSYLAHHPNIQKMYPETFLNQRRWENDFRV